MKKLIVPLLVLAPSCNTMSELLDVPGAVVADAGGAIEAVTPGDQAAADAAGQVAQTGTTLLTGNAALGALAGTAATGLAAFFIRRKKKAPAA